MKQKIAVILSTVFFWGAAIWFTLVSIRDHTPGAIPFTWILLMAGWAESVNLTMSGGKRKENKK